jgi:ATP-binding cassette subfamily C (CFTR/MRP) protein 1
MTVDPTRQREKEYEANDPIVGANTTAQDEPVASIPITPVERDSDKEIFDDDKKDAGAVVTRSPSAVSEMDSSDSGLEGAREKPKKQKWSSRLNPLKRNPPPVPEVRRYSREKDASWISRLTFQWMQPIMTVCAQPHAS